jgi:hypothetical protein
MEGELGRCLTVSVKQHVVAYQRELLKGFVTPLYCTRLK